MSSELLKDTHSLLARQLRLSQVNVPTLDEATQKLLEAVNSAYRDFDSTRQMLERSLELSSQELRQANAELRVLLAERSAAEQEMEILHAQRLEATGLLAGGVAHDFNNLLAVIKGSCEVLVRLTDPDDMRRELVRQIETAAARAAALTRQLLVFSRRQVLEPRVIDLNRTIAGLEHIYQPLVGSDIELRWALDPKLPKINADPAQIEQVLVNLIVNARDAMPRGGTLELQTTRASAAPRRSSDFRSRTRAWACRRTSNRGFSSHFSPPRLPARERGWACLRSTASCAKAAGSSPWTAKSRRAPPFTSSFRRANAFRAPRDRVIAQLSANEVIVIVSLCSCERPPLSAGAISPYE